MPLEELKNDLDHRVNYFLTNYKSLSMKDSKHKDESVSNDVSLLISKFQGKFSNLFSNKDDDKTTLTINDTNMNDPLLKNIKQKDRLTSTTESYLLKFVG